MRRFPTFSASLEPRERERAMLSRAQGVMGGNSLRNATGRKSRDHSTIRLDSLSMSNADLTLCVISVVRQTSLAHVAVIGTEV
jgi:hypothetical protein